MTHVIGVVKSMTPAAITVETQDHKTVEVALVQSTVHVGDRVVNHAMPMNGKLQAHAVRFAT